LIKYHLIESEKDFEECVGKVVVIFYQFHCILMQLNENNRKGAKPETFIIVEPHRKRREFRVFIYLHYFIIIGIFGYTF